MENKFLKMVFSNIERPTETKEYDTNIGIVKFDLKTNSFYKNNDSVDFAVKYWFKSLDTFEDMVEPAMIYLNDNHHPHTEINITHNKAEVIEGVKSYITDKYLRD